MENFVSNEAFLEKDNSSLEMRRHATEMMMSGYKFCLFGLVDYVKTLLLHYEQTKRF